MIAEIIGVGAQLCAGVDGNADARFLAQALAKLGISLQSHMAAATEPDRLRRAMAQALERSDIVIALGALGEQGEEFAKTIICEGLGIPLELHHPTVLQVEEALSRRGEAIPPGTQEIAMQPRGAVVFQNSVGLVPGCAIANRKQCILLLPGIPDELGPMFQQQVKPFLQEFLKQAMPVERVHRLPEGALSASHQIKAVGLSQDEARGMLSGMSGVELAYDDQGGETVVTVTASGDTQDQAAETALAAAKAVADRLGPNVYGVDTDTLEGAVLAALGRKSLRIAATEGGTGSLMCRRLSEADSTGAFAMGLSATPNRVKEERLGVPKKLLARCGAASEQVAAAMAEGIRKAGKAELGIAITGNTGGPGDDPLQPAGLLFIALCDGTSCWVKKLVLSPTADNRDYLKNTAVTQALNMVRLYIDHYPATMPGGVPLAAALAVVGGRRNKNKVKAASGSQNQEAGPVNNAHAKKPGFFSRIFPSKTDSKRDKIRKIILWVAVVVFIGSVTYIALVFGESSSNRERTGSLRDMFYGGLTQDVDVDGYPKGYLDKFKSLWAMNEDIAGWIKIGDTQVDYPVVQGQGERKNNDFYERRDFDRKSNQHGVPFVDFRVDLKKPSTNTVIYAHNMNDGQMFGELMNYKSLAYYQKYPTVSYDSVYHEGTYKIFGIVLCKKDDPDFSYHNFIDAKDDKEMTEFVQKIQARTLITTGVDVRTDDKLITLSTCDYTFKSNEGDRIARFVVFARKVREGEKADVDVTKATFNPNPTLPQEWYDQIKRNQAAERAAEEQKTQEVKAEAAKWFTSTELSGIAEAELSVKLEARKAEYKKYLSDDELSKLATAEAKAQAYQAKLSGEEPADFDQALYDEAEAYLVERGDMDWLSGSARRTFVFQMIAQPKSAWERMCKNAQAETGGLTISESEVSMEMGGQHTLTATMSGGTDKEFKWKSSNDAVCSVEDLGGGEVALYAGTRTGTATITCMVGGKSVTARVKVTEAEVAPTISTGSASLIVGESMDLGISLSSGSIKSVKWSGGNGVVELSDSAGEMIGITGIKAGTATVTAKVTTNQGSTTLTCKVKVKESAPASSSKPEESSSSSEPEESSSSSSKPAESSSSSSKPAESSSSSSKPEESSSSSEPAESSSPSPEAPPPAEGGATEGGGAPPLVVKPVG